MSKVIFFDNLKDGFRETQIVVDDLVDALQKLSVPFRQDEAGNLWTAKGKRLGHIDDVEADLEGYVIKLVDVND